jgi:hypothetical protein
MEDTSSTSALGLIKSKRYAGEPGAPCLEFLQTFRQYHLDCCTKALSAQRDTPMAALVITQCLQRLQERSEAFVVLEQARIAAMPAILAASKSLFVDWEPTDAERSAALRGNLGLPEYEDHLTETFRTRFQGLCERAADEGLLASSDGSRSSSKQQDAAAASSSGKQGEEQKQVAAASSPAALTTAVPVVLIDDRGNMLSPNMYVVERILFEIAFGVATQQQENEFKALKQGNMTADAFAHEIEYRNRTLLHRKFTSRYLVHLFINGLQDRECATFLQQQLQIRPAAEVTLDRGSSCCRCRLKRAWLPPC